MILQRIYNIIQRIRNILLRIKIIFTEILNKIISISKKFKFFVKENVFKLLKKHYILWFVKSLCFLFLFFHSFQLTFEYLSFEYNYKLIVSDYKQGIDFPVISVCTDNSVFFFDDQKVLQKFKVSEKVKENHHAKFDFWSEKIVTIKNNFTFESMLGLTVEADQFIECYGHFHFYDDPKPANIENCSESLQIMKSIYGNQDFGICYKIVSKNRNIYLKDNDFFQIKIKLLKQFSSLRVFSIDYERMSFYPVMYLSIDDNNRNRFESRDSSIILSMKSSSEIKIRKTSLQLLSTPYMEECNNEGKFF